MGLSAFDTYIEVIMAHRGDFHRRYFVECLDSLLMKNRPGALITQPRVKNAPRRFILDSRLLEVLLQMLLCCAQGVVGYHTEPLRIERSCCSYESVTGSTSTVCRRVMASACQVSGPGRIARNVTAFTARLREIGSTTCRMPMSRRR